MKIRYDEQGKIDSLINNIINTQKMQAKLFFTATFLFVITCLIAQSQSVYVRDTQNWDIRKLDTARDSTFLSEMERDIVLELNMARSDPQKYATLYIKPMLTKFVGLRYDLGNDHWLVTSEGTAAVVECIAVLNEAKPCSLLYPDSELSKMSKYQTDMQGATEQVGHNSPNGDTFSQRLRRFKILYLNCAENINYGRYSARDIVVALLVDDAVPSRGHRTNILTNLYNKVGVSHGTHLKYRYMCVMDFIRYIDFSRRPANK